MTRKVGFHIHTRISDGYCTLAEIIYYATKDENLKERYEKVAITDHDTTAAWEWDNIRKSELHNDIKPKSRGILQIGNLEIIQGIELTAKYKDDEVHVLGLYIDPPDEMFKKDYLQKVCDYRFWRASEIVKRLNEQGIPIKWGDVRAEVGEGIPSRLHVAYVLHKMLKDTNPELSDSRATMKRFIGKHSNAYVPFNLDVVWSAEKIIQKIVDLNGIPVWAHPWKSTKLDLETTVQDFIKYSDGKISLETQTPDCRNKEYHKGIEFCRRLAKKYHCLRIPGTDFHGRPYEEGNTLGKKYSEAIVKKIENVYKLEEFKRLQSHD